MKAPTNWREREIVRAMQAERPIFWFNPSYRPVAKGTLPIAPAEVTAAAERLERFKPFFKRAFPDTVVTDGLIESPVVAIPSFQRAMNRQYSVKVTDQVLLKLDAYLPISGSIKARGGIYEVITYAEQLALAHNYIQLSGDYQSFCNSQLHQRFADYTIAVGSTGNLGLSIGLIGRAMGFQVTVHMSADAKQWKKDKLRAIGARVIEYDADYGKAVAEGRAQAASNPRCHFIDDEQSRDLLLGYAVAGRRTADQLTAMGITPTVERPLYVYLPCGVGGGPGGVAYGLKLVYGDAVHPIFAEPIQSPCMMLGLATEQYEAIAVQDIGLTNRTAADGLAVARPSQLVSQLMIHHLNACYTIDDDTLHALLRLMVKSEAIFLEPSALAGAEGPWRLMQSRDRVRRGAYHLIWSTGGAMVPANERRTLLMERGIDE